MAKSDMGSSEDWWLKASCYGSSLGSIPDISQKYKIGRHKQRNDQNTLGPTKNIQKKFSSSSLQRILLETFTIKRLRSGPQTRIE